MGCVQSKVTFPPDVLETLQRTDTHVELGVVEGRQRQDQVIPTTMIFRNLRTPHKRANYLYGKTVGCFVLSDQRMVGYVREGGRLQRHVHVVFDQDQDKLQRGVEFSIYHDDDSKKKDRHAALCIKSDLAIVSGGDKYSGTMELRYHLTSRQQAEAYLSRIQSGLARGTVEGQAT
eukprot:scaffold2194_cov138-Amphora_coffeaeformis.AAC.2